MEQTMRTLIYGNEPECVAFTDMFRDYPLPGNRTMEFRCQSDGESLHTELVDWAPELVVVLTNGAAGMEGVYRVREYHPRVPVFWFSDDGDFAMQSYRLNCSYFGLKPVTEGKLRQAFYRCAHVGIPL